MSGAAAKALARPAATTSHRMTICFLMKSLLHRSEYLLSIDKCVFARRIASVEGKKRSKLMSQPLIHPVQNVQRISTREKAKKSAQLCNRLITFKCVKLGSQDNRIHETLFAPHRPFRRCLCMCSN